MKRKDKIALYLIYLSLVPIAAIYLLSKIFALLSMASTVANFAGLVLLTAEIVFMAFYSIHVYNTLKSKQ